MSISWNLESHADMFKDKKVLDLGCHYGDSSREIASFGANSVVGIEIRQTSIDQAIKETTDPKISYFCEDITNYNFIDPLVANVQVIACFGVFYHLFDHFRFLSHILKPNIETVLLETLGGPDCQEPAMFWSFELTDSKVNGWFNNLAEIPHGSPNISWIIKSAKLFGFEVDLVERRIGIGEDTNRRMVVRLYNSNTFTNRKPLLIKDVWQ